MPVHAPTCGKANTTMLLIDHRVPLTCQRDAD
jgi:hypothetical protein